MRLPAEIVKRFINGVILCLGMFIITFIVGILLYEIKPIYGIGLLLVSGLSILEIFIVYFGVLYYDNREIHINTIRNV